MTKWKVTPLPGTTKEDGGIIIHCWRFSWEEDGDPPDVHTIVDGIEYAWGYTKQELEEINPELGWFISEEGER